MFPLHFELQKICEWQEREGNSSKQKMSTNSDRNSLHRIIFECKCYRNILWMLVICFVNFLLFLSNNRHQSKIQSASLTSVEQTASVTIIISRYLGVERFRDIRQPVGFSSIIIALILGNYVFQRISFAFGQSHFGFQF